MRDSLGAGGGTPVAAQSFTVSREIGLSPLSNTILPLTARGVHDVASFELLEHLPMAAVQDGLDD